MDTAMRLTVLGTRGSCPVSGTGTNVFGGASSCYMVEAGDQLLLLDAGSGILHVPEEALCGRTVTILLTHTHIDHILGLPLFAPLSVPGKEITLYCRSRNGLDGARQLERFLSPPLWPCPAQDYPARLRIRELPEELMIGDVKVYCAEAAHPGGSVLLRLERGGKSLVYASDHELGNGGDILEKFAAGTDLLLCDAQFDEEEYAARRGYGHSTAAAALRAAGNAGARKLLLIHHDPRHDDEKMLEMERALPDGFARYAREGEVIRL